MLGAPRLPCSSVNVELSDERAVGAEHGEQRGGDAPLVLRREVTGKIAETADVNGTNLFDENAGRCSIDLDLGA